MDSYQSNFTFIEVHFLSLAVSTQIQDSATMLKYSEIPTLNFNIRFEVIILWHSWVYQRLQYNVQTCIEIYAFYCTCNILNKYKYVFTSCCSMPTFSIWKVPDGSRQWYYFYSFYIYYIQQSLRPNSVLAYKDVEIIYKQNLANELPFYLVQQSSLVSGELCFIK